MTTLSIIIVSYNTGEFLRKSLQSVFDQDSKDIKTEVIVVDNASLDATAQIIEKEFAKVIFIQNKENYGFSKANNIGVKKATGEYILFLNPDTIVNKESIEIIIEFMDSHKDAGVATCRINLPDGNLDDACHRGFPNPWNSFCYFFGLSKIFPHSRLFSGYSLGFMDLSKIHQIDACAGAFMMVRREAGQQVTWWDEDFFWYGEDLDFCYRLKQKGWKIYFIPSSSILHYKGVSGGIKGHSKEISTASMDTRKRATYARFEAMKLFYKKHYIHRYPKFLTWVVFQVINLKLWIALGKL